MGRLANRNVRMRNHKRLRVPAAVELRYQRALKAGMGKLHDAALDWLKPKLHLVALGKSDSARADATGLADDFERKVRELSAPLVASVSPAFNRLAQGVAVSNARALKAFGLDIRGALGPDLDRIREWNVSLIKNAANDFASDVGGVLSDPESWGLTVDALAERIRARADVSISRALLIARDQTSKTNGAINKLRQTHAGISSFEWSTSRDERVRDSHASKEGQVFRWDSPPADTGAPGEDVQCRCVAIPVLDEGADEDEE